MNSIVLLILGMILINSLFTLIPMFYPDSDPGLYLPYQFWINILLIFNCILPERKGTYLFDDIGKPTVDGGEAELAGQSNISTTTDTPLTPS
tara:strand:+ start:4964 stop:5239 length:276 start_codon:yes stop_codon:yes gene_type:complete